MLNADPAASLKMAELNAAFEVLGGAEATGGLRPVAQGSCRDD